MGKRTASNSDETIPKVPRMDDPPIAGGSGTGSTTSQNDDNDDLFEVSICKQIHNTYKFT